MLDRLLCTLTALGLLSLMLAAAPITARAQSPVHAGYSAMWLPTGRSGEGFVLEVLDADTALLYWFTYDEHGGQRWMTAVGDIDGHRIDFPDLVVTSGGRFGPDFDPDEVVRTVVGQASLSFDDCHRGTFDYQAFGQQQSLPVERLTTTLLLDCDAPGAPPVTDRGGQSASWYDPTHSGEGYTLQWLAPGDVAIVVWYSYDTEGRQYWMLGVGALYDGALVFSGMHATRGARFGQAFDADDVERFDWGELSLGIDCTAGTARYQSVLPEFGNGTFNLVRLTQLHGLSCAIAPPPDLGAATWSLRSQTGPALSEMPAVALGDAIYVAGGLTSLFANSRQFWRYEPAADRWTRLQDLPEPRDHGMMTALDGRLYFLGGYSLPISSPSNSAWRFDPQTGQWAAIAPMPAPRAAGGAAALDGHLYVTDGHTMGRYDPVANAWQTLPMHDPAARDHSAMVAYRGELWILGGRDHHSGFPHGTVTIFNPRTGVSRAGPPMASARSGFGAAVIADQIVVAGGEGFAGSAFLVSGADAYSPITGTWRAIAAPPITVHGLGAAAVGGQLYLMLGSTRAGGVTNPGRVQVLDLPEPSERRTESKSRSESVIPAKAGIQRL